MTLLGGDRAVQSPPRYVRNLANPTEYGEKMGFSELLPASTHPAVAPRPDIIRNMATFGHALVREAVENVHDFLRHCRLDPEAKQYRWGGANKAARIQRAAQSFGWLQSTEKHSEDGITFVEACQLADCDPDLIREQIVKTFDFTTAAKKLLMVAQEKLRLKEIELGEQAA